MTARVELLVFEEYGHQSAPWPSIAPEPLISMLVRLLAVMKLGGLTNQTYPDPLVIHVIGQGTVEEALQEMRAEAKQKLLEQQIEGVKTMVEKKVLVSTEVIEQAGFVVGVDKLADGSEHRVQFEMATVNPKFQPLYLGKKVGDVVEGANGTSLIISEVYRVDQTAADAFIEAEAAKQPAGTPPAAAPAGDAPAADASA